jgi:ABC-type transport system involved in cytochrome bd biosynthesis fused ATPase/permease subunit
VLGAPHSRTLLLLVVAFKLTKQIAPLAATALHKKTQKITSILKVIDELFTDSCKKSEFHRSATPSRVPKLAQIDFSHQSEIFHLGDKKYSQLKLRDDVPT